MSLGGVFDSLFHIQPFAFQELIKTEESSVCYYDESRKWSGANILVKPNNGSDHHDNFATDPEEFSNFTIYFEVMKIQLHNYSLQTRTDSNEFAHFPIAWVVQASNDKIIWNEIHRVSNAGFDDYGQIKNFQLDDVPQFYKYFRFTQTQCNSNSTNHFVLHRVEFFGQLLFTIKQTKCINLVQTNQYHLLFAIFLIK